MNEHQRNQATDNTRIAIEFLTLWLEPGDQARLNASKHIARVLVDPNPPEAANIVAGLLNLNMFTLLHLVKEQGASNEDLLAKAGDFLRHLSPQLPEL